MSDSVLASSILILTRTSIRMAIFPYLAATNMSTSGGHILRWIFLF